MPLHPEAQAFLDLRKAQGARNVEDLTVEQARAQAIRLNADTPREDIARVRDLDIPREGGTIPLRLYSPNEKPNLPLLVFFHGGGWVTGNLDVSEALCRAWANAAQVLVVSVNYRHGPEHKFPAAAEDAYTATKWLSMHAHEIQGDAARIAVSGISAGGGLAATTSLMARDRGGPPIAFQVLWVPVLDYNFETRSYHENASGYGLQRTGMQWYWKHYLQDPRDGANPYCSPLRAADLSRLPPALVVTAEYDPLADEGAAYADRLRAAGVPVEFIKCKGMIHSYLGADATRATMRAIRAALDVT